MSDPLHQPVNGRVSASIWAEVRLAFISGRPAAVLAEQYGIRAATISKRASRGRWASERAIVSEITGPSREKFEGAKEKFRLNVALSFEPMLKLVEQMVATLQAGDIEGLNTCISALVKLHQSGRKHFGLNDNPQVAIIVAGDLTSRAEPEADERALDLESVEYAAP